MANLDPALSESVAFESTEQERSVEHRAAVQQGNGVASDALVEVSPPSFDSLFATSTDPSAVETIAEAMADAAVQRKLSGRYRSTASIWRLELRVDVDGRRPMRRVSGDFYRASGMTVSYFGSFVVNAPTVRVTATEVDIEGIATTTWNTNYRKSRVTIARHNTTQPPAPARIQWMTTSNQPGATYICQYESPYFRSVQFEQDYVIGITGETPFSSYDTSLLPSGGAARVLSVETAYAEAGVEMQTAGTWNPVPLSGAGSNSEWSNAELHAAMEKQFSLWKDMPQWKVWLLAAQLHESGPGLYGIMFDQKGKQRQGCAVFHAGVGGMTPDKLRLQLYTYVHELGHCFNLFHSFHKKYMNPPLPNRVNALSWMNYPWGYPAGPEAFWSAFPFQFDNLELIHLRHAFLNNIIIGGNPFGVGAALEAPEAFADSVEDHSGLMLELEAPKPSVALGEPVVVELKLKLTDLRGKRVHTQLHPNKGAVQIGIRKPGGQVVVYEPMMEACVAAETVAMDMDNPAIYDSAYIGYGKDGFYFDQVGTYHIRAAYYALDGSEIMSNIMPLRVRAPHTLEDEEIADLFLGDDQGALFYLLGSDSQFLSRGNEALDQVLDKHRNHPLSVYARLIKGINESREFKTFTTEKDKVNVRKPRLIESKELLTDVVDVSEKGKGIDNITLSQTMRKLAEVQKAAGDEKGANATISHMVEVFRQKDLKPHVQRRIEQMAEAELEGLITEEE